MKLTKNILVLLVATLLGTVSAFAGDATVYAIHGIDGRDLGLAQPLPVDVSVDGACALPNFRFGEITDGIALPAGRYDLAISLRDRENPCSGTTVISGTFDFRSNHSYSLVAHLDGGGAPTATRFRLDTRQVRDDFGRLVIAHTAVAPEVDVTLSRRGRTDRGPAIDRLSNGGSRKLTLADGTWLARIYPALASEAVGSPAEAPVADGNVTIVYAVGSLANDTFGLLAQVVPADR